MTRSLPLLTSLVPLLVLASSAAGAGCGEAADHPASAEEEGVTSSPAAKGPVTGLGGKCLDVFGGHTTDGATVGIWDCNGEPWQSWAYTGGTLRGIDAKCLDVSGGGRSNGTRVQLYTCNGTPAQQWTSSGGQLINPQSGLCLDANGNQNVDGAQVQLWDCWGGPNQQWQLPAGMPVSPDAGPPPVATDAGTPPVSPDAGPPPPADSGAPTGTGAFTVRQGQIFGPDGTPFVARGMNVADWAAVGEAGNPGNGTGNGTALLQLFPGINFVRLNCQYTSNGAPNLSFDSSGYNDDPANFATFIAAMTAAHVVVEIEDHQGGNPVVGGATQTAQHAWYTNVATYYRDNPYVWFGTINEPGFEQQVIANQVDTYGAIRGTGNASPILLEINFGPQASTPYPDYDDTAMFSNSASSYAPMTNVVWDVHTYGWGYGGTSNALGQAAVNTWVAAQISTAASIQSASGKTPVIIGEYGTSTDGANLDASGTQDVTAVQFSGVGSAAWSWSAGATDALQRQGARTSFGDEVAKFIAGAPPSTWTDTDGS